MSAISLPFQLLHLNPEVVHVQCMQGSKLIAAHAIIGHKDWPHQTDQHVISREDQPTRHLAGQVLILAGHGVDMDINLTVYQDTKTLKSRKC